MNQELVNAIMARTGLPQETAEQAALAMVDHLKSKMPGPIAAQIDNLFDMKDSLVDKLKHIRETFARPTE